MTRAPTTRPTRISLAPAFAAVVGMLCAAPPVRAELSHRVGVSGGFEGQPAPELGGHGWALVAYDLDGLPADGHFGASLNTDTLRLSLDRFRILGGVLEAGAHLDGEAVFAGLLPDYYRQGRRQAERGFYASYVAAGAYLKANLPGHSHLELAFGARRWIFTPAGDTSEDLVLPPEAWVFEPRVRYTFWWLRGDPSLRDAHRLYPRVRGLAFGVDLGFDVRTEGGPWGALDLDAFSPVDPRNAGRQTIFVARQWLRGGWQLHDRVRVQVAEHAGFGHGEDDLTRARLGGMNPFVVPLTGAPWAAVLSERYLALQGSVHFRLWRQLEAGALADVVVLEDPRRTGTTQPGAFWGAGVFADLAIGAFQVDVRAGWTPSFGLESGGSWSVLAALGWGWAS